MNTGGFTETIWHFAGYLRVYQDEVRGREIYSGEAPDKLIDGDDRLLRDRSNPVAPDEMASQPINFRMQSEPELSHLLPKAGIMPPATPIKVLSPPQLFPKRLDPPAGTGDDYGYGYGVGTPRQISVEYAEGGVETLISINQLNIAGDRDLVTSDAIRYADGSLVIPPELELNDLFLSMRQQADAAVPDSLPDVHDGSTARVIEAFESRDVRWAETDSPNPDGSPVSHVLEGRYVDGVISASEITAPTIEQIAPWRPAAEAPQEQVTTTLTSVGPSDGVAVLAETGLNVQINVAVIVDANEAAGSMIVGGDYFYSRGIVQVNVLVDSDRVDIAVNGTLKPNVSTQGNEVHNVAEFVTHRMTVEPNGAAGTPAWKVSTFDGNFYDVKSIVQFNALDDSDRVVQAESGTYFDINTGANLQYNLAQVTGLSDYDVIIIGGDYHRADWIYQYNILLDSDLAKLYATGDEDGRSDVTTGFNALTNSANITTYDPDGFKPMLPAHWDLLDALDSRLTILIPNADWDLNGNRSGTLNVLYVSGDYYDVNVITQINLMIDADQSIQANANGQAVQGDASGGNTAINEAYILDPGSLSASSYLGGDAYEESVLIQTNIITDSDTVTIHDTQTLVPELVAFAQHAEPESDHVESRPVVIDSVQQDHLTSSIMC